MKIISGIAFFLLTTANIIFSMDQPSNIERLLTIHTTTITSLQGLEKKGDEVSTRAVEEFNKSIKDHYYCISTESVQKLNECGLLNTGHTSVDYDTRNIFREMENLKKIFG